MPKYVTTESGRRIRLPTPAEDAAIKAGIEADADTRELGAEEFKTLRRIGRPRSTSPTKVSTTIRFDADVLEGLRATGPGWQTRANSALREWLVSLQRGRRSDPADRSR